MIKEPVTFKSTDDLKKIKKIKLSHTTLSLCEGDIIHVHVLNETSLQLEEAIEMISANKELTNSIPHLCLMTLTKFVIPTSETMDYFAGKGRDYMNLADALVINSLPQRILGNFYLTIVKPKTPTKFFKNETLALEWLNSRRRKW